ncbi:FecR family protein [Echinicola shivajiensis]|uniref:FecR family protein n=1 Tax=Echinicola shivajiensis TaxID=1035916 RepID=UPI001BFC9B69|nr:FecR domain-containing protein [Echinicola shivajiensis]
MDEEMPQSDYDLLLNNIIRYSNKKNNIDHDKRPSWQSILVAASVIFFVALGLIFFLNMEEENLIKPSIETVRKSTLYGQRLTFTLPDGSKVLMNSGSEIIYNLPFEENRFIVLKGEAFFDVACDEKHPFAVQTGEVITKVLGTSFNIKAFPEDEQRSIAVVSGKVSVSDDYGNQALLMPTQKGVFSTKDKDLMVMQFSKSKELGWKNGELQFDHLPIDLVFKELERWYGVKIEISDKEILKGTYTGSYKNASFEKTIKGICFTMGLNYSINENKVRLYK